MINSDPSRNEQTSEMSEDALEVIGKARRSFGFSLAILILGVMAIALALVYRVTRDGESVTNEFTLQEIAIPAGTQILSVTPTSNVIVVIYQNNGDTVMRIIDPATGEVMKDIPVIEEAPTE